MLPIKTLNVRGSTCHGGKMSKVRVSVLLAASMDGSQKLQPFVIGKARAPRCFKNCKQLPVRYAFNKAWMTRQLFTEWLQAWDAELGKSGRHACLLVNCSAHHTTCELENIALKFLSANTTAKWQLLDHGIIKSFKVGYRRRLIDRLLAGLVTAKLPETCEHGDSDECMDDPFHELSSLFLAAVPAEVSADDFVNVDSNVQAAASLADENIVAAVAGTQVDSSSDDEDCLDEGAATRSYSTAEVAARFSLIHRCCGDMEGTGLSHLNILDKIEVGVFNFI
ncbi:tigger transposable element-derived protein 6-like [Dermacentor albipictus]|uniref:tigger transposable element-derived protein 6-like n=1 Tax=Dermacentor albipictus TaxID=60249 RepID=UPI0038FCD853